jgi:hypothetical protein
MDNPSNAMPTPPQYPLPWYRDQDRFPEDPDMWNGWSAQDYTLSYALGVSDNVEAERVVVTELERSAPELLGRLSFDSERGCFFAHSSNEEDMVALVAVVADLVATTHPASIPGRFEDSPTYIRRWDSLTVPHNPER